MPNAVPSGERIPEFFEAYGTWMGTPPPSWADIAWLREQWGGAFMVKGITRVDEAKRAVEVMVHGAFALHGFDAEESVITDDTLARLTERGRA